jgi:hypothetical protein
MRAGASFDPETIDLLRRTLDRCWDDLRPYQRATTSKTLLAERLLAAAAEGERDPVRLRHAALEEQISAHVPSS